MSAGEPAGNGHRSGSIAVIGRPNVGKSTLVNALVGAKVSIVSNRPQTTRHRLLGIATFPEGQIALVDTPGLHRQQGKFSASAMSRVMNRTARGALEGVDAGLLVVEAGRWDDEDSTAYKVLHDTGIPVVLCVNKIDRLRDKGELLPYLAKATEGREFAAVHPISALKRNGLDILVRELLQLLPIAPAMFGEDEITDRSERFLAGELLREQLMRLLGAELPYATTAEIERFAEDGELLRIGAVIWVERESQKAIVIGKGGARLKEIGSKSRIQMERLFGRKVFLETWVRVREGWSGDESALKAFGYGDGKCNEMRQRGAGGRERCVSCHEILARAISSHGIAVPAMSGNTRQSRQLPASRVRPRRLSRIANPSPVPPPPRLASSCMRITGERAFVLHARAWRETSLLVEVLSESYGRLGLVARGVQGPKRQVLRAALQPLQYIRLDALLRGELATLVQAEALDAAPRLPGEAALAAFYVNELVMRLAQRQDPQPELFAAYTLVRGRLAGAEALAWTLRRFERDLLQALGFGFDLEHDGEGDPVDPAARYLLDPEQGPQRMLSDRGRDQRSTAATGSALLALAADRLPVNDDLASLRLVLRSVLSHHLGGRGLKSWEMLGELGRARRRAEPVSGE